MQMRCCFLVWYKLNSIFDDDLIRKIQLPGDRLIVESRPQNFKYRRFVLAAQVGRQEVAFSCFKIGLNKSAHLV